MQPWMWALIAVGLLIPGQIAALWALNRAEKPAKDPEHTPLALAFEGRLAAVEVRVEALPGLWKGEADRAEDARDREYRHAQRASEAERRSKARADDLDQEPEPPTAVPVIDATVSGEDGVPDMSETMVSPWADTMSLAKQSGFPWAGGD